MYYYSHFISEEIACEPTAQPCAQTMQILLMSTSQEPSSRKACDAEMPEYFTSLMAFLKTQLISYPLNEEF